VPLYKTQKSIRDVKRALKKGALFS